ncbi:hypothetical protein PIB30_001459 [Stylosanthes scabra]|uniref:Uncharacterized protein n=1 Tax=Stylosanthes scabra TaxID=79078 RepID=A0ABU6Q2G1_9FABA|nr:hypothetical protein [Stylosanthes scabra]
MGEENESVRGRRDPSDLFAVEILVRVITETEIPETLRSPDGEVDIIVNAQLPNIENENASAEEEGHMTRGDRGRGDRGRGTRGRRGQPRKMTDVPLVPVEADVGTLTQPVTSTLVVQTPSLSEGLPAMRMIPTPGSRVQSSDTPATRSQRQTPYTDHYRGR